MHRGFKDVGEACGGPWRVCWYRAPRYAMATGSSCPWCRAGDGVKNMVISREFGDYQWALLV